MIYHLQLPFCTHVFYFLLYVVSSEFIYNVHVKSNSISVVIFITLFLEVNNRNFNLPLMRSMVYIDMYLYNPGIVTELYLAGKVVGELVVDIEL